MNTYMNFYEELKSYVTLKLPMVEPTVVMEISSYATNLALALTADLVRERDREWKNR